VSEQHFKTPIAFVAFFLLGALLTGRVWAVEAQILIPAPPDVASKSYFLEDFHSGRVLGELNADERLSPASLTKIVAAYVVFRELASGNLKLSDQATISEKAWKTPGSKMFIEVGKQVPIEDLIKGMVIQSGNDASVALAEHIAGEESVFAQMMNQNAARLGMKNSHFVNSHGDVTPEERPQHYSTARDLAIATQAIIREFPEYYKWHAMKEFYFNGIKQLNRNKLLWRDESVDGVKTGHTEDAGFCLVASAKRDGMRLISVVMGAKSEAARASANQALLNYGFRFFETRQLYKANEKLAEVRVWRGERAHAPVGLAEDLHVTIPRKQYDGLKATVEVDKQVSAPVEKGKALGRVNITLNDEVVTQVPLVALKEVGEGGLIRRLVDQLRMLVE
jgi:D-alanyl-D-alanine carboxypeptidase (penicillin-binding protein 5/6)